MEAASLGRNCNNMSTLNESVSVRLYKKHTASSKLMFASTLECNKAPSKPLGMKTSTLKESVFDRLYKAHTASSKAKCRVMPLVVPVVKDGEDATPRGRKNVRRKRPLHTSAPALAPPQCRLQDDSLRSNSKPRTTPPSNLKPPATSSNFKCRSGPSIISPDSSVESPPHLNAKPRKTPPSKLKPPATSLKFKCRSGPSIFSPGFSVESPPRLNAKPRTIPPSKLKPPATSLKFKRKSGPSIISPDSPPIPLQDDLLLLNATLRTTLLYHKKYDPETELSDITSGLASLKLVQTFAEYEASRMTKLAVAGKVIDALFHRDFPPCDRWEINSCTVEELSPDLFAVEKHATWDWEDNYSVTQAKATIRFGNDEIKVEEYSFFRCWLKFGGKSCKKMYYGFQKKEKDVPSDLPMVSYKTHPSPPRSVGKVDA